MIWFIGKNLDNLNSEENNNDKKFCVCIDSSCYFDKNTAENVSFGLLTLIKIDSSDINGGGK